MPERFWAYEHLHFLLADQGMREIHIAAHAEFIGGIDANAPVTLDDLQRLQNLQETAFSSKPPGAGFLEHLHERVGGGIYNRNFDGIEVDLKVVNAAGVDFGKR